MDANQQLVAEIEAYAAATGMAVRTFCKKAAGNSELVERMRGGGSVTLKIAERVRNYIRANPAKRAGSSPRRLKTMGPGAYRTCVSSVR